DVAHGICRRAEQDGIDRALVLEGDLRRGRRQGEDDMVVGRRQQLGLPRIEPFGMREALAFPTVAIAAGVVGATDKAAIAALFEVPTKRRRATGLDRRHDTSLDPAELRGVAATERLTVVAEDIPG